MLRPALAPTYEADKDGGEHVKVRKTERSAANFSVAVMFNVPGFSVVIDKQRGRDADAARRERCLARLDCRA